MFRKLIPAALRRRVKRYLRKREAAARKPKVVLSPAQLAATLGELDVGEGDVLFVHSSMEHLGLALDAVGDLVSALDGLIGAEGTLAMPAFSFHGRQMTHLQRGRVFDVRGAMSLTGILPEHFRRQPDVLRSVHPSHSVIARGHRASELIVDHPGELTFAPGTPMARLVDLDAKIAMLGIDTQFLTLVHVIEDLMGDDFPVRVHADEVLEITVRDASGAESTMRVRPLDPEQGRRRVLPPFEPYLAHRGVLRRPGFDSPYIAVIDARPYVEVMVELAKQGYTVYGSPPPAGA